MPTTRAGTSSGGDDDTGIGNDASTSQRRESRALTYADFEQLIQALRTLRPDAQPDQPVHGPINTAGLDKLSFLPGENNGPTSAPARVSRA